MPRAGMTSQNRSFVSDQGAAEEGCIKCDAVVDMKAACSSLVHSLSNWFISPDPAKP
jgi:hypothetical protein